MSVRRCPQCGAPLAPSRFARAVQCEFCGASVQMDPQVVEAARFREALARWQGEGALLGGARWKIGNRIASGEISEVYLAERARWPTERAVLKVLRAAEQAAQFDNEWNALAALAAHADLVGRVPQPIAHGVIGDGAHAGSRGLLLRHPPGFRRTFEDVRRAYPKGVDARASVWMWRRVLETLHFVHRAGFVHGAITPARLLVEDGEHGVLMVGFGKAARGGDASADVAASARAIESVVPDAPAPLAALLEDAGGDAWALRERVGAVAKTLFGAPSFHPV